VWARQVHPRANYSAPLTGQFKSDCWTAVPLITDLFFHERTAGCDAANQFCANRNYSCALTEGAAHREIVWAEHLDAATTQKARSLHFDCAAGQESQCVTLSGAWVEWRHNQLLCDATEVGPAPPPPPSPPTHTRAVGSQEAGSTTHGARTQVVTAAALGIWCLVLSVWAIRWGRTTPPSGCGRRTRSTCPAMARCGRGAATATAPLRSLMPCRTCTRATPPCRSSSARAPPTWR
jgi:hypothetical protein